MNAPVTLPIDTAIELSRDYLLKDLKKRASDLESAGKLNIDEYKKLFLEIEIAKQALRQVMELKSLGQDKILVANISDMARNQAIYECYKQLKDALNQKKNEKEKTIMGRISNAMGNVPLVDGWDKIKEDPKRRPLPEKISILVFKQASKEDPSEEILIYREQTNKISIKGEMTPRLAEAFIMLHEEASQKTKNKLFRTKSFGKKKPFETVTINEMNVSEIEKFELYRATQLHFLKKAMRDFVKIKEQLEKGEKISQKDLLNIHNSLDARTTKRVKLRHKGWLSKKIGVNIVPNLRAYDTSEKTRMVTRAESLAEEENELRDDLLKAVEANPDLQMAMQMAIKNAKAKAKAKAPNRQGMKAGHAKAVASRIGKVVAGAKNKLSSIKKTAKAAAGKLKAKMAARSAVDDMLDLKEADDPNKPKGQYPSIKAKKFTV